MRAPGEILLIAGYELGHQPLAVAWPAAFLERLGYRSGRDGRVGRGLRRPARQAGEARGRVGADAHRASHRRHGHRPRARGEPRLPPVLLRPVREPQCRVSPRPWCRQRDRRRGGRPARRAGDRARDRRGHAELGEDKGAAGRALSQAPRLSRPEPRAAPCPSDVREDRARRPARSGRVRRGEPRLPASLPALPDPAGLWRPVLRGAARRRPRGHPATGGGGCHAHHLRRPRLSERARRMRSGWRASSTRRCRRSPSTSPRRSST